MEIINIIAHTPGWVFLVFLFLLYRGYKATKSKTRLFRKIFILPVVFVALVLLRYDGEFKDIIPYMFCGIMFGWLIFKSIVVKADKTKKLLYTPASIWPMILIVIAIIKDYLIEVLKKLDPQLLHTNYMVLAIAAITGVTIGVIVGRTIVYTYKYIVSEHTDLELKKVEHK